MPHKPSPFPHQAYDRRLGFTLTELLTVIAIIGILAAIIIPVMGRVRLQARFVEEASNLRSIALAAQLYSVDKKGKFPKPNVNNYDGWAETLIARQPSLPEAVFASPLDNIERTVTGNKRSFGVNARIMDNRGVYQAISNPPTTIIFAPRASPLAVIGKSGSAELYGAYNFSLFRDDKKLNIALLDAHIQVVTYDSVLMKDGGDWYKRFFLGQ